MNPNATLKNFDFAFQAGWLALWALIQLRSFDPAGSPALLFPFLVVWGWAAADTWRRWRAPLEDERVRHIILMSGYLSRQLAMTVVLALALSPVTVSAGYWPLVMIVLLLLPDLAFRRWFGLRTAELALERSPRERSFHRVSFAAAMGFALLLILYMGQTLANLREAFTDYSGPALSAPAPETPAPVPSGRTIRRVPKDPAK